MNPPDQQSPYPDYPGHVPGTQPSPYPAYYSSPPPPPRRWVWFLVGAGSTIGVGVAVGLVVLGIGLIFVASSDPLEYSVDQSSVESAVDQPCQDMRSAASDIILLGRGEASSRSMSTFITSIRAVSSALESAAPDADARAWRDDMDTLALSLETYATRPAEDDTRAFEMPRDHGSPITDRMYDGSPLGCEIPARIEMLDPGLAADYD